MTHKIVFLDRSTLIANIRRPDFAHEWTEYPATDRYQVGARLRGASIAIANKAPIGAEIIDELPELRLIAIAATGVNNVDLKYCAEKGITVCNIRDYSQFAVSEHCFALALTLRRNLIAYRKDVLEGAWQRSAGFCLLTHPISDLRGSVLGILGHGAIGQQTAALGQAFGMTVLIAERRGAQKQRPGRVSFEKVLQESDILSVHCPLKEDTVGLISTQEFARMKPTSILINTARGGVVDEAALLEALKANSIAGAGLDVLAEEPPTNGHLLLDLELPNLVITPHIGWASAQAMQGLADQLIDNIEAYVAGHPQNLVGEPTQKIE
jgi:glycerate dehydrogenase